MLGWDFFPVKKGKFTETSEEPQTSTEVSPRNDIFFIKKTFFNEYFIKKNFNIFIKIFNIFYKNISTFL